MAKKAIKGIPRTRHPKQKRPPTPYESVEHAETEEHPVDTAVERRFPQKKSLRKMRRLSDQMMAALGDQRYLWLRLEEVQGEYHLQREEIFFNIGYEHGLAAGRADALQALMPACKCGSSTNRGRAFAARVRDLTMQVDLSPSLVMAVLLEVAWALALGFPQARTARTDRRS
ncbi:MAG: hypothetical protein HY897_16020 [Deltaproteobacteria bacterium]|nr:hypothetical protein [Deltaproteobacteria bacterium]